MAEEMVDEMSVPNTFPYTGQGLPRCPPMGHNHSTSGKWLIFRGEGENWRDQHLIRPELPEDAPSPLFRGPEEPLEPGEVFEEEEFWAEGLWEEMWEDLNGKTWFTWLSDVSFYNLDYDDPVYRLSRKRRYKIQKREKYRKNDNNHKRRHHQIKQPGGSSCNQR